MNIRAGILAVATASFCFTMASAPLSAQQQIMPSPQAQGTPLATFKGKTSEEEKVQSATTHHYASPATEANDAMLITAVKSALSKSRVAAGQTAVVVDCDHGTVTLAGVVASASEARRAGQIASTVQGVKAVNNRLTW
ncbi:MAG: BON domain-containing protein [Candidatus Binataceae bacterium]